MGGVKGGPQRQEQEAETGANLGRKGVRGAGRAEKAGKGCRNSKKQAAGAGRTGKGERAVVRGRGAGGTGEPLSKSR